MSVKSSLSRQFGTQFDTTFDVLKSNSLYDKAGAIPRLDFNFAKTKSLLDSRSTQNLITFTRASTATYVDSDRLIKTASTNVPRFDHNPSTGESLGLLVEEARTNSFMNSINFLEPGPNADHRWQKDETYIIPNADIAPDGTFTASKVVATTATAVHRIRRVNQVASPSWASIYLKAAEYTICDVYDLNVDTGFRIDLTTGVISESPALLGKFRSGRYGVDAVGNGWYRVRVGNSLSDATAGNPLSIYPNGAQSFAGTGTSGVLVWGAQLEAGAFPTSYIPTPTTFTSRASTATYYDASGVIQTANTNVARSAAYFPDSNGVMRPAGLLLEAAATNLLTYSEQFDNAAWAKTEATVTANATTAPDGTSTADKLVESSNNDSHTINQLSGTLTPDGNYYTASFYVKPAGRNHVRVQLQVTSTATQWEFNLLNYSVSNTYSSWAGHNAVCTPVGNGWVRCVLYGQAPSIGGTSVRSVLQLSDGASNTYQGDGTSGVYIWGAQLETGAFPTSYIPTTSSTVTRSADVSSSATVTRSADVAQITGTNFSSWYNQSEGTTFVHTRNIKSTDYSLAPFIAYNGQAVIWDNLKEYGLRYNNGPITLQAIVRDVSAGSIQLERSGDVRSETKAVIALSATQFAYTSDGLSVMTSATSGPMSTITQLLWHANGDPKQSTHFSRFTYYPVRLPDATLQALTR